MPVLADYDFHRLEADTVVGNFSCGNNDLDEFLKEDALDYAHQLLAVTYLFVDGDNVVAFFSVLNDVIAYNEQSWVNRRSWLKFLRPKLPYAQRGHNNYPAVKLGRLAVDENYSGQNIGTQILDAVKMSFVTKNKTGCRFITVDAYNNDKTISFYQKNGFYFFPDDEEDKGQTTRLMYFDLKPFKDGLEELGEGN